MKLKTGQCVQVKKGILCPDDPEFDISGWRGRIIYISDDEKGEVTIGIAWDSITLKEMPNRFIEKSEEEELNWAIMNLFPSDVKIVESRDSENESEDVRKGLALRFQWEKNIKEFSP